MGYKPNNEYIIENDVDESNELAFEKQMKRAADINNGLPDGYEIKEVLVGEETVGTEDERIREPMTTTEVLEKIDALQKEVDSLKEENIQLKAEISTLRG